MFASSIRPGGPVDVVDLASLAEKHGASAVVWSLGNTNTGSVDSGSSIRTELAKRDISPWVHVDAAMGAHWMCSEELREAYAAVGDADSIAFDFHKGFQVQYDCGAFLSRDPVPHLRAFAIGEAPYLRRDVGGIASDGMPWPGDLGFALSRQFRALRAWATIRAYGGATFSYVAHRQRMLGDELERLLSASGYYRVLSNEGTGVVCFALRSPGRESAVARVLQQSGEAVVTTTTVGGFSALRACIMGHRTEEHHITALVTSLERAARLLGRELSQ